MTQRKQNRIFFCAGDVSGDVHASNLMKELKNLSSDVCFDSVGGQRMKALSDTFLYDMVAKGANGFVEPIKKIFTLLNLLKDIKNYFDTQKPSCVVLTDFFGFNSRVMKAAYERNIPVYYYVCPQVWASRKYRAKKIVKMAKKMFVIFPFEKKIYTELGGDAIFLGNPLLDTVPEPLHKTFKPDHNDEFKIGMMPGSRRGEIEKHTKLFWQAFKEIKKTLPNAKAYLFAVPEVSDETLFNHIGGKNEDFKIVREKDYKVRRTMDFIITCSGTATLENALLNLPMVVVYKTSWITYLIARMIIRVPYISLVNILRKQQVVKELIQHQATAENIAKETIFVLSNQKKLGAMCKNMSVIREHLGMPGVAKRVAEVILGEVFHNK
ncbi:MAG: lipid-A-disaccharide synthase [Elusimicrobiaceae bacterium]|nr:lipid-A-disaccharide synthase [Elusimicrobiaceae bacterium]